MLSSYRNVGLAVLEGIFAGALFVLVSKGSGASIIGFLLSPMPIAIAGLTSGSRGLLISCIAATFFLIIFSNPSNAVLYITWDILPTVVMTSLLLKNRKNEKDEVVWYPLGYAISWTAIFTALIGIMVSLMMLFAFNFAIAMAESGNMEKEALMNIVSENVMGKGSIQEVMFDFLKGAMAPALSGTFSNYESILKNMASVFMAMMSIAWFFRILFAVLVAHSILATTGKSLRTKLEYMPMYVQNWLLVLLVVSLIAGLAADTENFRYIVLNFAIAISLPFCILGLTQVHIWARALPYTKAILFVFYALLTLAFFLGVGMAEAFGILAVIGLYEQFVRIYRRYIRPLENGEK